MYVDNGGVVGACGDEENEDEQDIRWDEELRKFQDACTAAAIEVEAAMMKKKKTGNSKEMRRATVGKWNRISKAAARWTGRTNKRKWIETTFAKEMSIREDELLLRAVREGKGLKEAVREACRRPL